MKKPGQVRIIGGRWRSRRVRVAAGVRPSPAAVRETLFNWLPHTLEEHACLDLFAGSGALGFEAASRGAPRVVLVESHPATVRVLRTSRRLLGGEGRVEIFAGTAQRFLRDAAGKPEGFDVVFLDPPYGGEALGSAVRALAAAVGVLNPAARVYMEAAHFDPLPIPATWHIIRRKRCGLVDAALFET